MSGRGLPVTRQVKVASSGLTTVRSRGGVVMLGATAEIGKRKIIAEREARQLPYCPAVTPPPFATYFQEKEGGGRNNEDLRFRLAVKPPPPPSTNSRTL